MEFASLSKGNAALTTGIIGTAGVGLGLLGNLLGVNNGCMARTACGDMGVSHYELSQEQRISELQAGIALRDANIYNDQKLLEVYKYFDGEVKDIRNTLCAQAVQNQAMSDAIARERDERCCADNKIVNYVNATFYPKMVADVTVGTTSTAQTLYNPLYGCCGGCNI